MRDSEGEWAAWVKMTTKMDMENKLSEMAKRTGGVRFGEAVKVVSRVICT